MSVPYPILSFILEALLAIVGLIVVFRIDGQFRTSAWRTLQIGVSIIASVTILPLVMTLIGSVMTPGTVAMLEPIMSGFQWLRIAGLLLVIVGLSNLNLREYRPGV